MREICLATIDGNAWELAEKYNLFIELDQFCTAMYMDPPEFPKYDAEVKGMLNRAKVFHGPFNELAPCAIDPKVRQVSMERYNQAFHLMLNYGLNKMVFHGGFVPLTYYPVWYIDRSIEFWTEFLENKPADGFVICLENVMESEPDLLVQIVSEVNDPRLRLCLDVGHANIKRVSSIPLEEWVEKCAPYLEHVHLHNNDGEWDWHKNICEGTIDMKRIIQLLDEFAPEASFTFENIDDTEQSIFWYQGEFR